MGHKEGSNMKKGGKEPKNIYFPYFIVPSSTPQDIA
jgi:hypothetical protein